MFAIIFSIHLFAIIWSNNRNPIRNELKRLNVTVINALNETPKSDKPVDTCQKPYCKLGCICDSIQNAKYVQTHCQLTGCMFGCVCSGVNFSLRFLFSALNCPMTFVLIRSDSLHSTKHLA